jgi:hypothetical protein
MPQIQPVVIIQHPGEVERRVNDKYHTPGYRPQDTGGINQAVSQSKLLSNTEKFFNFIDFTIFNMLFVGIINTTVKHLLQVISI